MSDVDFDSVIETIVEKTILLVPREKPLEWSQDEIKFLEENYGILDDNEIGEALGRTANAIKVFRVRRKLKACSQAGKAWLTANRAARLLGIDAHKLLYWCRQGLIPAKFRMHIESGREYILIGSEALKRWVVNPANWVYFDWRKLKDAHLRRLCELRANRWGDEWWNTTRVAEYHGVEVTDVKRLISRGAIKAFRPPVSLGGRNFGDAWRNNFVLRSEATRADLVFIKGRGKPGVSKKFSPAFDAFILKARDELKLEWDVIAKMTKVKVKSAMYRYWRLKKHEAAR